MSKVPKTRCFLIFAISWRMKFIYCLKQANKHFLQADSITLTMYRQAYPKYPKQQIGISLQYLKENVKDEGKFLSFLKFLNWYYILSYVWPGIPKLLKISLLFLCNTLRKKWMIKLMSDDFLNAFWHKSFLQSDSMIFDGDDQTFSKIESLQCLYNTSEKKLEMKVDFLHADKHQIWIQYFGHQSFLPGNTITNVHDQAFSRYSK